MRSNQIVHHEDLPEIVTHVLKRAKVNQAQAAAELNVSPSAVSQAVRRAGSKYTSLQRRLIQRYSDFDVESVFRLKRQD